MTVRCGRCARRHPQPPALAEVNGIGGDVQSVERVSPRKRTATRDRDRALLGDVRYSDAPSSRKVLLRNNGLAIVPTASSRTELLRVSPTRPAIQLACEGCGARPRVKQAKLLDAARDAVKNGLHMFYVMEDGRLTEHVPSREHRAYRSVDPRPPTSSAPR